MTDTIDPLGLRSAAAAVLVAHEVSPVRLRLECSMALRDGNVYNHWGNFAGIAYDGGTLVDHEPIAKAMQTVARGWIRETLTDLDQGSGVVTSLMLCLRADWKGPDEAPELPSGRTTAASLPRLVATKVAYDNIDVSNGTDIFRWRLEILETRTGPEFSYDLYRLETSPHGKTGLARSEAIEPSRPLLHRWWLANSETLSGVDSFIINGEMRGDKIFSTAHSRLAIQSALAKAKAAIRA